MDAIKERIISKSLELFIQTGVKVITMDMICEELGMSKKTLYEHFPSKEDLIKQTFNEQAQVFIKEIKNKITNFTNSVKQLYFIFENLQTFYFIKDDKISFQLQKFYPQIYFEISATQNNFIKSSIENNITSGIKEGLYRSKLNKNLVVEYIVMILFNRNNTEDSLKAKDQKYFFDLLIRSLATKKGLKEL